MNAVLILPARDEEACIGEVVAETRRNFAGPIIVVDNGSRDATAARAAEAGARVTAEPVAGYGRACMAGVAAAPAETDVFVFMDADGSDDPATIPRLLAAIENGAGLALAVRGGPGVERGAIAPAARFGNWLSGSLIGLGWGRRLRDLSPLKAVRAETLAQLAPRERTYGWTTELLATAVARGVPITEVETGYRHRRGGESKVSGTIRGSSKAAVRILGVLGKVLMREMPLPRAGAAVGVIVALAAMATFAGWLVASGPSSSAVLVAPLLLLWPAALVGCLGGMLAGTAISRLRPRRTA